MGKHMENVANNYDMSREIENRALQEGSEVVAETQEDKSILEAIERLDIDQEIIEAKDAAIDGIKSDAADFMEDSVRNSLDEAGEKVEEISSESQEQIDMNNLAGDTFSSLENYGKEQVEAAKKVSEEEIVSFEDYDETAIENHEGSEEEYNWQLEDILG